MLFRRGTKQYECPRCGFPDMELAAMWQHWRKRIRAVPIFRVRREPIPMPKIKIPRPEKDTEILQPAAQIIKEPEILKKESIWALLIWLPLKRLFLKIKRIFGK